MEKIFLVTMSFIHPVRLKLSAVYSRRIFFQRKKARRLQWHVFFRQITECMRSGRFLQNY